MRAQLAHPVLQHARRAHDERVGRTAGDQVRDDGDGLHRLAQAHLVAQDDAALGEREAGPERLVPAQRDRQQRLVERLRLHAVDQLGGQVPGRGGDVAARGGDAVEQRVVRRGPAAEVLPDVVRARGLGEQPDDAPRLLGEPRRPRPLDDRGEHRDRRGGPTPPLAPREQAARPARGDQRVGAHALVLRERGPHLVAVARDGGVGLVERVERLDERGRDRVRRREVDPEAQALAHGARHLLGGGEQVRRRLGADLGELLQPVAPEPRDLADRPHARVRERPEPQALARDVAQRRDVDGVEARQDLLLAAVAERGAHLLAGRPGRGGEGREQRGEGVRVRDDRPSGGDVGQRAARAGHDSRRTTCSASFPATVSTSSTSPAATPTTSAYAVSCGMASRTPLSA